MKYSQPKAAWFEIPSNPKRIKYQDFIIVLSCFIFFLITNWATVIFQLLNDAIKAMTNHSSKASILITLLIFHKQVGNTVPSYALINDTTGNWKIVLTDTLIMSKISFDGTP